MKNFTLKIRLFLTFLWLSSLGMAQVAYPTVGIVGTATASGWEVSTPMKLAVPNDQHQWTLTVYLTAGECKFRANNSWDVNWGASAFPTGTATLNASNITIPKAGYYTISFNDLTLNYHFEAFTPTVNYETLGLVGNATANGWDISTEMTRDIRDSHTWFLENISLTSHELKFRANNTWDVSWGGNYFPLGTAAHSGSNIKVREGQYHVMFNDVTLEYFFRDVNPVEYTTVGIIGSSTENGWEVSTPMELLNIGDPHNWTLNILLNPGDIKFRANDNWDANWGASQFPFGISTLNGPDLGVLSGGYYNIRFNDITGEYKFTSLSPTTYDTVGIIGTATPEGWDASTPMIKSEDGHTWTLTNFELTTGELKFRANNSWGVNWGSTEFPTGTGFQEGPNIPITGGIYNITLNDFTGTYHFELISATPGGIVTLAPPLPTAEEPVTITYDASQGASNLQGAEKVYMHSGVVLSGTEGSEWSNVTGNWGNDDGIGLMTLVEGETDKWQISLPSIREHYNVEVGVPVFKLAMVFRNADGTLDGKSETGGDIFTPVDPGDFVRFTAPVSEEFFGMVGEVLQINAEASGNATTLKIEINEGSGFVSVAEFADSQAISYDYTLNSVEQLQVRVTADLGGNIIMAEKTLQLHLRQPNNIAELPAGMHNGINYDPTDPTRATLVLLAPDKEFVYAVGDFNSWQISNASQMNQTADGEIFWLELSGLEPQKEYVYQYWVEGTLKIGDPYAHKVADPFNDGNIPSEIYPDPVDYDKTEYGIATVLQTAQEAYQWLFPEAVGGRPENEDLVIYELLIRDFVESHSYTEAMEKLPYLKELGVNAIELMPIMEFENNESWGYNPSYLLAADKYYGTHNDLKAFIDKAHEMGMVVLLDMVLNHHFGQSPLVQMYFDEVNNRPSEQNPWFNPAPTHPFNVGYDFNHESQYTKNYIDDVNRYWLEEFNFDGYRFDLSKGFTQTNNLNDVGAWSSYDQSRVDILKRMTNEIWETDPEAYVIMEHLAENSEEKVLADHGILLWGNMNHNYGEAVLGNFDNADLTWALSRSRGWNDENLVAYMESHDEERLMVKALNFGFKEGDYNIKDIETALERVKLASAFYYPVPGPKMIWQFGEMGYDIPIDFNGRTGNKPSPWSDALNYDQEEARVKLYETKAAIINLVNDHAQVFEEGNFSWTPTGQLRRINISHADLNVTIVGNFGTSEGSLQPGFPFTGTWYDFFSGEAFKITSADINFTLAPGEFHIFVDQPVEFPEDGLVENSFVMIVEPSAFTADLDESFSINLSWEDNSAGENGYVLQRRSEDQIDFMTLVILNPNTDAYIDSDIIDGVTYEYRLQAISTEASSAWTPSTTVNLALLAPDYLTGSVASPTSVNLYWADLSEHESVYIIERAMQYGQINTPFSVLEMLSANTVSFTDTQVRPGVNYQYRVLARDSDETSEYSKVLSLRPANHLGNQQDESMVLFPNPASGQVTISTSLQFTEPLNFQVVNLQGVVLKTFQMQPGNSSVQLEVSELKEGIYIVNQESSEGAYRKLLLIKR